MKCKVNLPYELECVLVPTTPVVVIIIGFVARDPADTLADSEVSECQKVSSDDEPPFRT